MTKNVTINKGSSHQSLQPPPTVHSEGIQDVENRILALDSSGAHQRNVFIEPRLLHLPIHRKALNSLTWDVWFSLINSNLLIFRLPGFCCKSYISWILPYLFRAASPSELSERLPAGLKSSASLRNKTQFSTFRWCFFFFFSFDRLSQSKVRNQWRVWVSSDVIWSLWRLCWEETEESQGQTQGDLLGGYCKIPNNRLW